MVDSYFHQHIISCLWRSLEHLFPLLLLTFFYIIRRVESKWHHIMLQTKNEIFHVHQFIQFKMKIFLWKKRKSFNKGKLSFIVSFRFYIKFSWKKSCERRLKKVLSSYSVLMPFVFLSTSYSLLSSLLYLSIRKSSTFNTEHFSSTKDSPHQRSKS